MPIRTALWKVGALPTLLGGSSLAREQQLEDMIVAAPGLVSDEWMLIGRQADTGFGGRIDLLAIAPDASLVLIALKRDRTPREVVAQALDYAGWVESLKSETIRELYERFAPGESLAHDFRARFGTSLGEFYCSFGHDNDRNWEDARELGFVSGGGGAWYSRTLQLLNPGDRLWVKVPGAGFVGVGTATGRAQPISEFTVRDRPLRELAKRGSFHAEFDDDPERCEYFVPVDWIQTVPLEQAIQEVGMFGNQNTVCKPPPPNGAPPSNGSSTFSKKLSQRPCRRPLAQRDPR